MLINRPHNTCVLLVAGGLNTHRWLRSDALLNREHSHVSERTLQGFWDTTNMHVSVNKWKCSSGLKWKAIGNAAVGVSPGAERRGLGRRRTALPLTG